MIRAGKIRARQLYLSIVLMVCLLFSLSARPQQPDSQEGTTVGNYNIRQSAEMGYRVLTERGNSDVFDTIVDEHSGLRLLDGSFEMHSLNHSGLFFDSLSLSSFGLGGEANSVIRLRAYKNKVYNFNASFRRDHNFWDYNLLANPLNPPTSLPYVPILNSPHRFDIVRRMSDYNFTLFPQSRLRFRLGYSRNLSQGPSFTSFHADDVAGEETLLFQPWRQTQNAYQFGVDLRVLPRTNISYDQFLQFTKGDNSQVDRNFNFQLSNGAPVDLGLIFNTLLLTPCDSLSINTAAKPPVAAATCSGFLAYSRFAPMRTSSPTEQLGFQSNYFKKLEMSGRFMYNSSTGKVPTMNELFNGLIASTQLRQYNFTGSARSRRITAAGDFAATWSLSDRFRISDSFRFHAVRVPGIESSLQDSFFANSLLASPIVFNPAACPTPFNAATCPQHVFGSPADITSNNSFTFLGQEYKTNLLQLEYDFSKHFRARLGYRYRNRLITQRNLSMEGLVFFPTRANRDVCLLLPTQPDGSCLAGLLSTATQGTEINEHSLLLGLTSRLLKGDALRLSGDAELFWADNFFTRLNPRQSQHYRARANYQPTPWANISVALNILEKHNNSGGIGFLGHDRNFSFDALLSANERLGLDLDYDFTTVFSRANICFATSSVSISTPLCTTDLALFQTVSFYDSRTHFGRVAMMWKPWPRLTTHLGASLTSTGGDTLFLNPLTPTGSLRSLYLQPSADLDLQLKKGLDWKVSWGYYDYNEHSDPGPTLSRDFHAHVGTISLRYSF
ncbi:MAG TPA: hypothetical protein VK738_10115 [Terriglobales bacterium]|jgi:hypothetical protein|nr:hypothetical protein [Terriglobales bacterium]